MDRKELRALKEQLAEMDESIEHCENTVVHMRSLRKRLKRKILNAPEREEAPPLKSVRD